MANIDDLCGLYPQILAPLGTEGFECDDGWYWLVENLCKMLQHCADNGQPQAVVWCVKEKWGKLAVYADNTTAEMDAVIDFAECLSESICERCGNTSATQNEHGYIVTLCDTCRLAHDGKK